MKKNRFDRFELAGAFGDLGTLIPFIIGYISILRLDPLGIFFTFGILLIGSGLFYKTPIPVQPMKAIGGAAIAQATMITPGMVWGSGLVTGLFWLILGLTGKLTFLSKIASKPVIRGIVLGLGLLFIKDGVGMMASNWILSFTALILTFLLLSNRRIPAMFVLLLGVAAGIYENPALATELSRLKFEVRVPEFALYQISWSDLWKGTLLLAIPQIPLTLGNAVIAITQENNRLFPEHPVTENRIAVSQGLMNLLSPILGGIPICHGAGGMAGHVRFGARTGGSLILLGSFLLILGTCFSSSILILFTLFPAGILGVILFFAGLELAVSARDIGPEKDDFYLMLITAGFSLWNMGIGFLAGLLVQEMLKRRIFQF